MHNAQCTIGGTKEELRSEFRRRRAAAPQAERDAAEEAALAWLRAFLDDNPGTGTVAAYWAIRDEFPTRRIIEECLSRGIEVALPRWDAARRHYRWARLEAGTQMRRGPMGVPEPDAGAPEVPSSEIGLYLVPGLAFDAAGTRIGYGGGWFDRMLAEARRGAAVRGLCLPCQRSEAPLPREPHDIPAPPLP